MVHGGCSDANHTFQRPVKVPGKIPLRTAGKKSVQDCAVTLTLTEWLNGNDEDNSCWFDFMEAPRLWKTRWFWIVVAAACACIFVFSLTGIFRVP
jgi:hypothetical protein